MIYFSDNRRWWWDTQQQRWRPYVYERRTNHVAHIVMCIVTLGAWAPIYAIAHWRNGRINAQRHAAADAEYGQR